MRFLASASALFRGLRVSASYHKMLRDTDEAEAELRARQRAARKSRVQPSQRDRRKTDPKKRHRNYYTPASYGYAVARELRRRPTRPSLRLVALTGGHIRPNVIDQTTYLEGLGGFFTEIFGTAVPAPAVSKPARSAPRGPARR